MDSGGNSGSMQSSSTGGGGDEAEYDSSSHAFFHVGGGRGVSGGGGGNSIQAPSLQQQSSLFDSLSNFLITDHNNNLFSPPLSLSSSSRSNQNPSSSLNLDILLQNPSTTIPRSQLNNFNSLMTSSTSSPSHQQQSILPHSGRVASQNPSSFPTNNSTDHQHQGNINNQQPNRNPKKRSRASRRAPTTVLTTDTSNFRSMVQEFTGMPTQPFTSSSSLLFPRNTRLDLFSNSSTTSTIRSGGGGGGGDSSHLLRPFAQKPLQVPPFLSSSTSSMVLNSNASASTSTTHTNPSMTSSSNVNNFQLLSDQLGFPSNKNNQSSLNMQTNPSLIPYQSLLLQSNPINQSNDVHRENHSSRGGGGRGLPNLVTSDGLISNMPMRNSSSWENQDHILNANYNSGSNSHRRQQQQQMVTGGNAEKGSTGSQNVSTRGEGMVNSWICSSE
ncbi:probable serine/threonine-protein kinase DDB_G0276461 [Papaver somniferum]|uniref:probable serine/threonine-protein kinase DDB_G0276461 n=1 Tax=Papaver somniferum TaxID=3469 RepID=UPI000E6FEE96|nr:probable serine/threonine-protein kinase DDB_G0276461 [Papaver somniferum]